MTSPVLFHGPSARGEAVQHARTVGRMVSDPVGDDGLKVADSREVVQMAMSSGVGDKPPSVVIGPLDRATPEAGDALLKTLEDLAEGPLRIVLWADFLGGVIGTIRSRSLPRWCPPDERWVSPFMDEYADRLYEAWSKRDLSAALDVIVDRAKDWQALGQGFCEVLAEKGLEDAEALRAWEEVRPLLDGKGSHLCLASAFLEVLS